MSPLIQIGAGACAGAIAVTLGIVLLPQLQQATSFNKQAVAKPVFVAAPLPAMAAQAPASTAPAPVVVASAAPSAPGEPVTKDAALVKLAEALRVAPAAAAASPTRSLSFASTDTIRPAPAVAAQAQASPTANYKARQLFAQGLVALAAGDIAGARALLSRAVDEGDSRALMALGETYEPATLAGLGALGVKGDAARARDYYSKALAAGVGAAREHLAALESN
jgi:tetratricopeptide (TPR) repeat protein